MEPGKSCPPPVGFDRESVFFDENEDLGLSPSQIAVGRMSEDQRIAYEKALAQQEAQKWGSGSHQL